MNCDADTLLREANVLCCIPANEQRLAHIYLLCQWANKPTGPTVCSDADADSFFARASVVDPVVQQAVCNLTVALKSQVVWANSSWIFPFVGPNATGNRQNLRGPAPLTFAGGAFTVNDATGVKGDGVNNYADLTAIWPTNQNSSTSFFYVKGQWGTAALRYMCGTLNNTNHCLYCLRNSSSQTFQASANADFTAGGLFNEAAPLVYNNLPTSICLVRDAANSTKLYTLGNAVPVTSAAASVVINAVNFYIFAINIVGSGVSFPWDGKLQGFCLVNTALTGPQYVSLHNAWVAMNTAIGR